MPAILDDTENAGIPPTTEAKPKSISLAVPRADIKTLAWTGGKVSITKTGQTGKCTHPPEITVYLKGIKCKDLDQLREKY